MELLVDINKCIIINISVAAAPAARARPCQRARVSMPLPARVCARAPSSLPACTPTAPARVRAPALKSCTRWFL